MTDYNDGFVAHLRPETEEAWREHGDPPSDERRKMWVQPVDENLPHPGDEREWASANGKPIERIVATFGEWCWVIFADSVSGTLLHVSNMHERVHTHEPWCDRAFEEFDHGTRSCICHDDPRSGEERRKKERRAGVFPRMTRLGRRSGIDRRQG